MIRYLCRFALTLSLAFVASGSLRAQTYSWGTAVSGDWNSSNWTPAGVPNSSNDVIVSVGTTTPYTVTISSFQSANSLTISNSQATVLSNAGSTSGFGVGTLTVSAGTFNQTSGTLNLGGAATFQTMGALSFNGGTIAGSGSSITVSNFGTMSWSSGILQTTLTIGIQGSLTMGSGTQTLQSPGIINLGAKMDFGTTSGNLYINGGTLNLNSGAIINSQNNLGTISMDSGLISVNANVSSAANLSLIAPTSAVPSSVAGTAILTVNGAFNWNNSQASIDGSVTIKANGGGTWSSAYSRNISTGNVLLNNGIFNWSNGNINFTDNGSLSISGAGTLQLNDNSSIVVTSGSPTFTNAGLFSKSGGTGNSSLDAALTFTNSGTILISSGSLTINSVATNTGTLNIQSGGTINIGGTTTFSTGTTLTGTGTLAVNTLSSLIVDASGNTITAPTGMTFTNAGSLTIKNANFTLSASSTNSGSIAISSQGILTIAGQTIFTTGTSLSGYAGTTGALNIASGGTLTVNVPSSNLIVPANMTFTNAGTVSVTGGTLSIDNSANLSNFNSATNFLVNGTWQVNNATLDFGTRQIGTIASNTTVILSGSSATFAAISNLSKVSGSLQVTGGASYTTGSSLLVNGTLTVGAGSSVSSVGQVAINSNGTLIGSGSLPTGFALSSTGTIKPDSTLGILSAANSLINGGTFVVGINSWTSTPVAGTNYNQLAGITGSSSLTFNGAGTNSITIKVNSLTATNTAGAISGFDNTQVRTWVIADFGGGISAFNNNLFKIDTTGFQNNLGGGNFYLSLDSTQTEILLEFVPLPEPTSILAVAGIGSLVWVRRNRSKRAKNAIAV
ncbi:S-layer family protein [Telmatocola sphagniphila]|uniref:S-layer family protein n=1 Tax=Telmatocola sphagniphila TaxID=1123043 RepID=A0A8E6B7B4_9BACT|nr:hypothetical protein [Telmatocola sphagniphila]QVL31878.1 S-layer family protein [Telmatocola sphagniphila]